MDHNPEPITAATLLAEADAALTDDDRRALSLALGHQVAVLRMPELRRPPVFPASDATPRIAWQSDNELASVTVNAHGEISIYVVPHIDTKTAIDLAAAIAAVVAHTAGGTLAKITAAEAEFDHSAKQTLDALNNAPIWQNPYFSTADAQHPHFSLTDPAAQEE